MSSFNKLHLEQQVLACNARKGVIVFDPDVFIKKQIDEYDSRETPIQRTKYAEHDAKYTINHQMRLPEFEVHFYATWFDMYKKWKKTVKQLALLPTLKVVNDNGTDNYSNSALHHREFQCDYLSWFPENVRAWFEYTYNLINKPLLTRPNKLTEKQLHKFKKCTKDLDEYRAWLKEWNEGNHEYIYNHTSKKSRSQLRKDWRKRVADAEAKWRGTKMEEVALSEISSTNDYVQMRINGEET